MVGNYKEVLKRADVNLDDFNGGGDPVKNKFFTGRICADAQIRRLWQE